MARAIPARPADTTADAERVQVALLRETSIAGRLGRAFGLTATVIGLARRSLARADPSASPRELTVRFVELHYGAQLAAGLRAHLEARDGDERREP